MSDTPYIPLRKRLPWWGWASIAFTILVIFGWMTWVKLPEICAICARNNIFRKQATDLLFSLGPRATCVILEMQYVYVDGEPDATAAENAQTWLGEIIPQANSDKAACTALVKSFNDINNIGPIGFSILDIAAFLSADNVITSLIEKGADVNLKGKSGGTALMAACSSENVNTVRILINAGADVNARSNDDITPLYQACFFSSPETVALLIDSHADVNVISNYLLSITGAPTTPLDVAISHANNEIMDLLKKHGAKTYDELHREQIDKNGML